VAAPIGGVCFFCGILLWNYGHGDSPPPWVLFVLATGFTLGLVAYFPGNLSVLWPYAVEVDPAGGIVLTGPLKRIVIPIADIGEIEDSIFWQGYVVHLIKSRAALTEFVIPWYFGPQSQDLIRAIRTAVTRTGT
jgi:hypothetical protein